LYWIYQEKFRVIGKANAKIFVHILKVYGAEKPVKEKLNEIDEATSYWIKFIKFPV
jgi:hypothetical protein